MPRHCPAPRSALTGRASHECLRRTLPLPQCRMTAPGFEARAFEMVNAGFRRRFLPGLAASRRGKTPLAARWDVRLRHGAKLKRRIGAHFTALATNTTT